MSTNVRTAFSMTSMTVDAIRWSVAICSPMNLSVMSVARTNVCAAILVASIGSFVVFLKEETPQNFLKVLTIWCSSLLEWKFIRALDGSMVFFCSYSHGIAERERDTRSIYPPISRDFLVGLLATSTASKHEMLILFPNQKLNLTKEMGVYYRHTSENTDVNTWCRSSIFIDFTDN